MTFSSIVFLFAFLPVTFLLYALCRNKLVRNILLMAASLIFYAFGEPVAVVIMVISILFNYLLGLAASGTKHDRPAVFLAVLLNIGLLVAYKYTGFFVQTLDTVTGLSIPVPQIRLPIGISFFTFQGLSYVIDVYRKKECVQKNLFSVLLYIAFFPQLIAGPIVRYEDIAAQLDEREFTADRVSRGIHRFILGLGKKVLIANQMGLVADAVFGAAPEQVGAGAAWIGAVCYSLQIFFDFSGYSDMAIGLGCVFGFDFLENFNYPFISGNIQEFWRRWHISLSTWFKEYVYIPLGGNRKGKVRTTVNKLIVFFLTGFWHGANFTFILWGLYCGLFVLLERLFFGKILEKNPVKILNHLYVMLSFMIGLAVFRSDNVYRGFSYVAGLFSFGKDDWSVLSWLSMELLAAAAAGILLSGPLQALFKGKFGNLRDRKWFWTADFIFQLGILVLSVFSLVSGSYNPFIYFQF